MEKYQWHSSQARDTSAPIYFVGHALEESGILGASHEENPAALPGMMMSMLLKIKILRVDSEQAIVQFSIHNLQVQPQVGIRQWKRDSQHETDLVVVTPTENGHEKKGFTAQQHPGIGFNSFRIKNSDLIARFFDVGPG